MRITSKTTVLLAGALALVLTGCSTTGDPAPPEPQWTPLPSATPSSEPAEPGPDAAEPGTWAISDTGIGPIEVGGDFAATLEELPDWSSPQQCEWTAAWSAEGEYMIYFAHPDEGGPIDVVSVTAMPDAVPAGAGPRTVDDLGVGSTKEDVLAAHPDAEEGEAAIGDGSTWLAVQDGEGRIFFEYGPQAQKADAVTVTDGQEPPYEVCA